MTYILAETQMTDAEVENQRIMPMTEMATEIRKAYRMLREVVPAHSDHFATSMTRERAHRGCDESVTTFTVRMQYAADVLFGLYGKAFMLEEGSE